MAAHLAHTPNRPRPDTSINMNPTHIQRTVPPEHDAPLPTLRLPPSALKPLNVNLLRQGQRLVVIRNHARGLGVIARQRHTVIDIQSVRPPAARRPHHLGGRHGVALRVHLAHGPDAAALDAGAGGARGVGVAREEVGRQKVALDVLLEEREAVVDRIDDGEGEARRVVELDVQLAVLRVFREGGVRADVGLEAVEADGEDLRSVSGLCV